MRLCRAFVVSLFCALPSRCAWSLVAVLVVVSEVPAQDGILYPNAGNFTDPLSPNGTGPVYAYGTDDFGFRFAVVTQPNPAWLVPVSRGPMKAALAAQGIVDRNDFSWPNYPNGGTWTINWDRTRSRWYLLCSC